MLKTRAASLTVAAGDRGEEKKKRKNALLLEKVVFDVDALSARAL